MTHEVSEQLDRNNNRVVFAGEHSHMPKEIQIIGKSNHIDLGTGCLLNRLLINVKGSSNKIYIGDGCSLNGRLIIKGHRQTVRIGARTSFENVMVFSNEGCDITIGADCMFSKRVEIRTSDSHSIVDRTTGERVNRPGPVTIGDRVWIGLDVVVSKGVRVPSNSIVGAKSFVNKSIDEEYVLIAGVPATVIRRNVDWDRQLLPFEAPEAARRA